MMIGLAVLAAIGAGTVGGVFFAFSTFVMRALAQSPPGHGVAVMQRINVTVLNPLFLGVFMGTAVMCALGLVVSFLSWGSPRSALLSAAAVLYLVGSWGVTLAFNVPRNNRLAVLDAGSAEAAAYWPAYVREWTWWNHVRTAASLASAACSAASLAT